jgi:hypothetical protein
VVENKKRTNNRGHNRTTKTGVFKINVSGPVIVLRVRGVGATPKE